MSDNGKELKMQELEQVTGGKISKEQAYSLALKHANVQDGPGTMRKKCKLDFENGRKVYEVEFISGGMEYEYDIDAETGSVLKYERDIWD